MTNKLSEFRRINAPRIQRALDQIGHIEKSAASMRISDADLAELVKPLFDKAASITNSTPSSTPNDNPPAQAASDTHENAVFPPATTPVAREIAKSLESLCTQQLVDRMIACGAVLAARRK